MLLLDSPYAHCSVATAVCCSWTHRTLIALWPRQCVAPGLTVRSLPCGHVNMLLLDSYAHCSVTTSVCCYWTRRTLIALWPRRICCSWTHRTLIGKTCLNVKEIPVGTLGLLTMYILCVRCEVSVGMRRLFLRSFGSWEQVVWALNAEISNSFGCLWILCCMYCIFIACRIDVCRHSVRTIAMYREKPTGGCLYVIACSAAHPSRHLYAWSVADTVVCVVGCLERRPASCCRSLSF